MTMVNNIADKSKASNRRIDEIRTLLTNWSDKHKFLYIQSLDTLVKEYEAIENNVMAEKYAREIIDIMTHEGVVDGAAHLERISEIMVSAYDCLARNGDFRAYCIALEWNRAVDKKYYIPRMGVLERHGVLNAFQDMADDKLDLLVLNMPPRL